MAFNTTALDAFKDELAGGDFFKLVGQGTLADAFTNYPVLSKGTQQLNINNTDLNWTSVDVNGGAVTDFDTYSSNLVYNKVDLTVDGNVAQGYVTIPSLFGKYVAKGSTSFDDESAVRGFATAVAEESRFEYAKRLYTGFGVTPAHGLNAITGTLSLTGGTTVTSANIIAKIESFINQFLAVSGNVALENRPLSIVMTAANYRALRTAYRTANFFDGTITNEQGLMISRWLDDDRITVYGDPAYTGEMKIMYQDSVVVGTVDSGFHFETPEVWYNQDKNALGFRVSIFGGVSILESTHLRTAVNAA